MRQSQSVMLAQTSWISEGTIVSGYLKEILLRWWRYFREMLDEVHPQWWCLAYSIWNETFSIDHSTGLSPIAIEDILYRYSWSSWILHSSLLRVMWNWPTQKNSINLLADPRMLQLFIDFYAPQIRSKSEAHTRWLQRKVEAQTAILSRTVRELSSALLVLESHRLSSGLNPQDQEWVLRALCDWNESAIRQLRGLMMRLMGK